MKAVCMLRTVPGRRLALEAPSHLEKLVVLAGVAIVGEVERLGRVGPALRGRNRKRTGELRLSAGPAETVRVYEDVRTGAP